jgi:hypothetical protein
VDPNNSLLIDNGLSTPGSASRTNHLYTRELTNGTTVTLTRIGTGAATKTLLYTVLEFAAGVLNSAVQRGTTALTASPTDSTITSISTTRGAVNFAGMRTGSASLDATFSAVTLLNATAVRNYSDASTVSNLNAWEAFEFVRPPATFNDTISEGLTLADSLSAAALFAFAVAESVVTADALASAATFACVLSEVTACQDSLVAALQIAVVLAEQLTLADDMAFVFAALLVFFLDPKDLFNITGLSRPSPTGPAVLVLEDGGKLVTELGDSIQLK